nr:hypothetical protein BaRGS_005097 [Batillaria attramentaria]
MDVKAAHRIETVDKTQHGKTPRLDVKAAHRMETLDRADKTQRGKTPRMEVHRIETVHKTQRGKTDVKAHRVDKALIHGLQHQPGDSLSSLPACPFQLDFPFQAVVSALCSPTPSAPAISTASFSSSVASSAANSVRASLISSDNAAQNCLAREVDQFSGRPQVCSFISNARNKQAFIAAINVFGGQAQT